MKRTTAELSSKRLAHTPMVHTKYVSLHHLQTLEQRSRVAGSTSVVTPDLHKIWKVVPTLAVQLASTTQWRLALCVTTEDEVERRKLPRE